ncbi:hypothetical protein LOK49_LG11G00251 [Camellia lanceoleosa]|uniref:Uncharacterized protein n=1 Tax=Camellia lanceoleosa TaxID=1840588 RepID=A0ACC0G4J4_9ERIC|nr:hypothetical protein LOK49_LG11G00251 [Camellia lanceoleosa]
MEKKKEEVSGGKMMDHQMSEEIYTQRRGFDVFGKRVGFVKFNAYVVDKATGKKVLCLHVGGESCLDPFGVGWQHLCCAY